MLIDITGLNKIYKTAGGETHRALDYVDLRFDQKGLVFIVGGAGGGKSTLFDVLGGLERFDGGSVIVGGHDLGLMSAREAADYRNTMIGFILRQPDLIENMTALGNVKLALDVRKAPQADETAKKALAGVGLADVCHKYAVNLSDEQQRRVVIARAVAKDPPILLAEEPTGAEVLSLLREIGKDRLVIAFTDDCDAATAYGDRVIELNDAKVCRDFAPRSVCGADGGAEATADASVSFDLSDQTQSTVALKKGRLPLAYALRFGMQNLKRRPVQVICAALLTAVMLAMFGFAMTVNTYDRDYAFAHTVVEGDFPSVQVRQSDGRMLHESGLDAVAGNTGHEVAYSFDYAVKPDAYDTRFVGFTETADLTACGFAALSGSLSFAADQPLTDIMISSSMAARLAEQGLAPSAAAVTGRSFEIGGVRHTVVGVFQALSDYYSEAASNYYSYDYNTTEHDFYSRDGYMYVRKGYRDLFRATYSPGEVRLNIKTPEADPDRNVGAAFYFDSEIAGWLAHGENAKALDHVYGDGVALGKGEIFVGRYLLSQFNVTRAAQEGSVTVETLNAYSGRRLGLYSVNERYDRASVPLYTDNTFKIKGVFNESYSDENGDRVNFEPVDDIAADALAYAIIFSEADRESVLADAFRAYRARIGLDKSDGDNERLIYALLRSDHWFDEAFASDYLGVHFGFFVVSAMLLFYAVIICLATVLVLSRIMASGVKPTAEKIGLLRRLGAGRSGCRMIFVFEALAALLIAYAVAAILIAVIAPVVNGALTARLGFPCFLLMPGAPVYLLMAGIALAVGMVSLLFPLRKLAGISAGGRQ